MKLVSPSQRGTMCQCKCPGSPEVVHGGSLVRAGKTRRLGDKETKRQGEKYGNISHLPRRPANLQVSLSPCLLSFPAAQSPPSPPLPLSPAAKWGKHANNQ